MCHSKHFSLVLTLGLALVGCNRPTVDLTALQDEVEELRTQFEEERKLASKLRGELESFSALKDQISTSLSDFNKQQKEAMAGLDAIKEQFMSYRDEYKTNVRARAAGMSIPDFEALGRVFKNVVVKSVDDWEIAFKHGNGMARLNFADAPAEVRILFAYNPNVGPKPQKVVVPAAQSVPIEDLTRFAEGGSSSTSSSMIPAGDPFATTQRPQSVGAALHLDPSLAGNDSPKLTRPLRKARKVVFRDGTACEIMAEF